MKYFSGFCFVNESHFFAAFLDGSCYSVVGFSKGAFGALSWAQEKILQNHRVDKIQLFSPAFFQNCSQRYKDLQVRAYTNDPQKYMQTFLKNAHFNSQRFLKEGETIADFLHLEASENMVELMNARYDEVQLQNLDEAGVKIEVFLGGCDKVIDALGTRDFFTPFGTIYEIKNAGHFL